MLVKFITDYNHTPSHEAHLTCARTVAYKAGMIVEIDDECFFFANAIGAVESLEPPEPDDSDEDDEAAD